jgi:hypothetical protein
MFVSELTNRAVLESSIAAKNCFACGGTPSSGAGEHIIPKWLQNRYRLFDERLTLLNGTLVPYRRLTVPCCIECNTGFLSLIETSVQSITQRGGAVNAEERISVARWLSKILIGILVKETNLAFDRSRADRGPIVAPNAIDELRHCHFVMQSARKITSFSCLHSEFPFSLYFYTVANCRENDKFDLSTNLAGQSIAVRLGRLAAIFVNDGGLQMEVGPKGPFGLSGSDLSEMQFREVAARIHYKAALRDATHSYVTFENENLVQVEQLNVTPFSGYLPNSEEFRIFRDWNEVELSFAMSTYMRVDRSTIFDEVSQTCRTTLFDSDGTLLVNQKSGPIA